MQSEQGTASMDLSEDAAMTEDDNQAPPDFTEDSIRTRCIAMASNEPGPELNALLTNFMDEAKAQEVDLKDASALLDRVEYVLKVVRLPKRLEAAKLQRSQIENEVNAWAKDLSSKATEIGGGSQEEQEARVKLDPEIDRIQLSLNARMDFKETLTGTIAEVEAEVVEIEREEGKSIRDLIQEMELEIAMDVMDLE